MKSELELKIDELEIIRTALELKFEKFKDREQELKLGVMKEIFSKCLPEGYELKSRYDQWSIEFINNDKKFGDEIMSFRTLKSYEPKSRHLLDQISISTYSTSSHSEFELNRYIIIGKVAEVLKTRNDELITLLNTISSYQKVLREPTKVALQEVYKEISENRKAWIQIHEDVKLDDLSKGIKNPGKIFFKTNKEDYQNILFIRAVTNPSGKTFYVEIEYEYSVWAGSDLQYKKVVSNTRFTVNKRRILDFIRATKK